jgi:hypothetical protein
MKCFVFLNCVLVLHWNVFASDDYGVYDDDGDNFTDVVG